MSDYRDRLYSSYVTDLYGVTNTSALTAAQLESYTAELREFLPPGKDSRVLDAGCGSGLLLEALAQWGYVHVEGVDRSPQQVEVCRKKGLNVTEGDILAYLRSATARYDAIFCTDLIEHLTKDELIALFDAARAALVPGGRFIVRTINASGGSAEVMRYCDLTHENSFNEQSIVQVFSATGFTNISIRDNPVPFGLRPRRLLRWLAWRVVYSARRLMLVTEMGVDAPRLLGKLIIGKGEKG
jgi:cyclopropane fatty-acyl-phospholipid synthase-like methyltransferase